MENLCELRQQEYPWEMKERHHAIKGNTFAVNKLPIIDDEELRQLDQLKNHGIIVHYSFGKSHEQGSSW